MSQAGVQYIFADIENVSVVIQKAHGQVDTLKGDIRSSASTLQADWSGSASESWSTVQAKWDSACDALIRALNQLSITVARNGADMSDTETSNANLFSGM
jgi:WXG100 family type VII secretion target